MHLSSCWLLSWRLKRTYRNPSLGWSISVLTIAGWSLVPTSGTRTTVMVFECLPSLFPRICRPLNTVKGQLLWSCCRTKGMRIHHMGVSFWEAYSPYSQLFSNNVFWTQLRLSKPLGYLPKWSQKICTRSGKVVPTWWGRISSNTRAKHQLWRRSTSLTIHSRSHVWTSFQTKLAGDDSKSAFHKASECFTKATLFMVLIGGNWSVILTESDLALNFMGNK